MSPFWDMDHDYEWLFSQPKENLNVHMVNFKKGDKIILAAFGAGLTWGAAYLTWAYN